MNQENIFNLLKSKGLFRKFRNYQEYENKDKPKIGEEIKEDEKWEEEQKIKEKEFLKTLPLKEQKQFKQIFKSG